MQAAGIIARAGALNGSLRSFNRILDPARAEIALVADMPKRLRKYASVFASERPGRRFMETYRRVQKEKKGKPLKSVLSILLGVLLILFGFLLGFAPFLPGIVFGILGMALIVGRFRFAARFMDKTEIWLRKIGAKIKR